MQTFIGPVVDFLAICFKISIIPWSWMSSVVLSLLVYLGLVSSCFVWFGQFCVSESKLWTPKLSTICGQVRSKDGVAGKHGGLHLRLPCRRLYAWILELPGAQVARKRYTDTIYKKTTRNEMEI